MFVKLLVRIRSMHIDKFLCGCCSFRRKLSLGFVLERIDEACWVW